MNKTQNELDVLKQECEALNSKLKELTEDELKEVTGGAPFLGIAHGVLLAGTQFVIGSALYQTDNKADKEKIETGDPPKAA